MYIGSLVTDDISRDYIEGGVYSRAFDDNSISSLEIVQNIYSIMYHIIIFMENTRYAATICKYNAITNLLNYYY